MHEVSIMNQIIDAALDEINKKDVHNKNDDNILKVDWIEIRDLSGVFLYSNLEDKLQSTELKNKYGCSTLGNASFYTKENNHTGLFISEGNKLRDWKSSELFDGILSITNEQKALITKLPVDYARISVQSGPVLLEDNEEVTLNIINDKPAGAVLSRIILSNTLEPTLPALSLTRK